MEELMGCKELYQVILKTLTPIEIDGREFQTDEVVCKFDNLQFSIIDLQRRYTRASGGFDNRTLVGWTDIKEVGFKFYKGCFSKIQLSIMMNSKVEPVVEGAHLITTSEEIESDEDGKITLKNAPISSSINLYRIDTNEKISGFTLDDKEVVVSAPPYTNFLIYYDFLYTGTGSIFRIGQPVTNGFFKLTAKTRFKDANSASIRTGVLTIPKLQIISDLTMRLGESAYPLLGAFYGIGYPVGGRQTKRAIDLSILDSDIEE